jgi:predicted nucleic acid-binding protein
VIVADTNLLGYLLIQGPFTAAAEKVLQKDREWAAPLLWRSELSSVLSIQVRNGRLGQVGAEAHFRRAAQLISPEIEVHHVEVLRLAQSTGCSTYHCEFAWAAREAGVRLVTNDKKLLVAFSGLATSVQNFAAS